MPVTVAVLRESLVLAEVAEARRFAVANDTSVTPLASNLVQGSVVLDDAYGEPVLLVSITRARDIYDEGQHTLAFFLSILVIAGVVVAGLALILADRAVFRRLSRLAAEVRSVGENPDFSGAVSVNGHDEIGFLAGTINETLEALARTHRQLRDSHKQLETATADLTRTQAELGISANRLRRLTRHLQTMREDERTVVANEIPDEVGQGLTALKMDLSVLERVVAKGEAVTPDFLRRMTEVVNSLLDTVRRLSSGLRPSMLEDLGLAEAVEWHLSEFQKERAVETTLRMHGPVGDVEASRALTLFRMLQEALLVIAEDASVTRVAVTLTIENRYALLAVQDNGTAVIEGDALSRREMGLGLIRERAEVFGGGVTIASIPGAGTTVVAQVPR